MLNWFKNEFWFWRYLEPHEFADEGLGYRNARHPKNGRLIYSWKKNGERMILARLRMDIKIHWFRICNKKFRPEGWQVYKF